MKNGDYFGNDLANMKNNCSHIVKEHRDEYIALLEKLEKRMELLQGGLELSKLPPENFARTAKILFDEWPARFEKYSPSSLCKMVEHFDPKDELPHRIEWPNAITIVDTAFVTTEEWEALRRFGIGGSEAAAILGLSPWKTELEIKYDKMAKDDLVPEPNEKARSQAIFTRGHVLEDKVIEAFCDLFLAKRIPETRMFRSKEFPAAMANIDAIVQMPNEDIYIFEAKTTGEMKKKDWDDGKTPEYYVTQTRQYPAVLNDDRIKGTYIGVLFTDDIMLRDTYVGSYYDRGRFVSHLIERDKGEEDFILGVEQDWWDTYIRDEKMPPEPEEPKVAAKVVRKYEIGSVDTSKLIKADGDELKSFWNEYSKLNAEKKSAEAEVKKISDSMEEIKAKVQKLAGNASKIYVENSDETYVVASFTETSSTTIPVSDVKKAAPEIFDELESKGLVKHGDPTFRFSFSEKKKKKDWEAKP